MIPALWIGVAGVAHGAPASEPAPPAPASPPGEAEPASAAPSATAPVDAPAPTPPDSSPETAAPEGPVDDTADAAAEDDAVVTAEVADEETEDAGDAADAPTERVKPPRVDGAYIGAVIGGGLTFTRVNDLDTPAPFVGPGGWVRIGEVVFPWMSIGVQAGGRAGWIKNQRVAQGAVLVELGFLPAPKKLPLSLLIGFGAGGGAVNEEGVEDRSGFGGAAFKGAVRYDLFPGADIRRPNRGGGFSLGPELGWVGYTPAAAGRPMSNTVYLGLWIGYYFGS